MTVKSWDDRYAEFLERVMASAVAGGDPKPLQEELRKLLAEKPAEKKNAESQLVPTAPRRTRRRTPAGSQGGSP